MGKDEDKFLASMARLDGKAKFLHQSFTVGTNSLSSVTGKKLTLNSLVSSSGKEKEITKSYEKTIEKKKSKDRLPVNDSNSIEAKKLKRKGAFEVNKEKVSDWDSVIQSRRLAKSYDFTNHKSNAPLETIEESSKKFKVETPLEAEISRLLYGKVEEKVQKNPFLKDHSKDLQATRKHLAEIAKARMLARQKEAKDKYQSKIKSKRYRRALRKRKQELNAAEIKDADQVQLKADLDRIEERATLRHKTVSKKLRFYDQTNTKESEVRRTQNLESQRLRAKVDINQKNSEDEDADEDEDEIMAKAASKLIKSKKEDQQEINKLKIDPNNFVQATIKDFQEESDEELEDDDEEEESAFKADISTFDSGIEMEKKESEKKAPKVLPGWGLWSDQIPKEKKKKKQKQVHQKSLVMKDSRKFVSNHQLLNLPHPYKSLQDCQAELSQPVGDTFMPKTTVMKNTKPKIHVKLGAMLEADAKDEI